jgi:NADP-dependent 3-hydroxy acid dehydrogenase YdfG
MVPQNSGVELRCSKTRLQIFPSIIDSPHSSQKHTMSKPTLIVTGASRGIGKSIVQLAIQRLDANVIGVARSRDDLEQISQELATSQLADRFKFVDGDVTEKTTAERAIELAKKSWSGQIDGLVVNAG